MTTGYQVHRHWKQGWICTGGSFALYHHWQPYLDDVEVNGRLCSGWTGRTPFEALQRARKALER